MQHLGETAVVGSLIGGRDWSELVAAKGKRDECAAGKMTFDEFKEWLAEP